MSYYLPPQHLLYGGPVPLPFDPIAEAHRNWDAQGWGRSAEMAAVTSITRAHQIALQRIDAALEPFGLNFSRFEALALLHFTRAGALPMGKIGDRLQVHPTSVTNTIDRREADGLVERRPHPTDRRTTLAAITRTGHTTVERAAAALADVRFGVDGLDGAALEAVVVILGPMRREAGDF